MRNVSKSTFVVGEKQNARFFEQSKPGLLNKAGGLTHVPTALKIIIKRRWVTIEKDGSSHKMFIKADPQFKKVNLYDSNMKLVAKESVEKFQSVGQTTATKAVEEEVGNDKKKS